MQPPISSGQDNEDPVLTTRETARLLGVAVSTAQHWIESGALPSWKTPGGHRRVRRSAVLRLLQEKGSGLSPQEAVEPTRNADSVGLAHLHDTAAKREFEPLAAPAYPVPANEAARLLAVQALDLIGISAQPELDRLTFLAGEVTETPIALITLLTSQRQWFVSRSGVNLKETPREWAFCSFAILQDDAFVVEDARQDERFKANPLVTGEPHIRFYAGIPILDRQGFRLGTLCVLDGEPRRLREKEMRALRELATIASEEMARRS